MDELFYLKSDLFDAYCDKLEENDKFTDKEKETRIKEFRELLSNIQTKFDEI